MTETEDYVFGTKGTAKVLAHQITGPNAWKFQGDKPSMYDEEHRELFAAIRDGRTINNGKYMSYSTLMAIMGREACYSGAKIEWDKLMQSPMDLTPPSYEMGKAPEVQVLPAWFVQARLMPIKLVHIIPTLDQGGAERNSFACCARIWIVQSSKRTWSCSLHRSARSRTARCGCAGALDR